MSHCCRACVKAGRTNPGERATFHADEALRYARKARIAAIVALVLAGFALALLVVRAVFFGGES